MTYGDVFGTAFGADEAPLAIPPSIATLSFTQTIFQAFTPGPTLQIQQTISSLKWGQMYFLSDIYANTVSANMYLTQYVFQRTAANLSIQQIINPSVGSAALSFTQEVVGVVTPTLSFMQSIRPATPTPSDIWKVEIFVGGVDISASITGTVSVEHSEESSGVAQFSVIVDSGNFDPDTWTGKSVVIDYVATDSSDTELWRARRYTGIVSIPDLDTDTGIADMVCTTDNQRRVYSLTKSQIDSMVGGTWSKYIFDEEATNWQYMQDRISTQKASMITKVDGGMEVSSWVPSGSYTLVIDDTDRVEGSLSVKKAERSALINKVDISIGLRYSRLRQRDLTYQWLIPNGLCGYLTGGYSIPSREAVKQAAESAGWVLTSPIAYVDVWPPQWATCRAANGGITTIGWEGFPNTIQNLCIGASFHLSKRWAQTVTEGHNITVESQASIAANTERLVQEEYGLDVEIDDSWEKEEPTAPGVGTIVLGGNNITGTTAPNGDIIYDADVMPEARNELDNAINVAVDKARREISDTHRRNTVSNDIPLSYVPLIHQYAHILTDTLDADGLVVSIKDIMDIGRGKAISQVEVAVSRTSGLGIPDPVEDPVVPDKPDTVTATNYSRSNTLGTHIGGKLTSPPFDDTWDGWMTNYFPEQVGAPHYEQKFVVVTPDISDGDRQEAKADIDYAYKAQVRNDILTETP